MPDLGIELSTETAKALRAAVGMESRPGTFHDWMEEMYDSLTQVPSLATADLFLDAPSRHSVHFDERVEHVPCVMDALIAAVRADAHPVKVRSKSPRDQTVVDLSVGSDHIEVSPTSAVMSFGLSTELPDVGDPDDPPLSWMGEPDSPLRALSCRYINAFEDRAAYEGWADEQTDVATLPLTFDQGHQLAKVAAIRLFE